MFSAAEASNGLIDAFGRRIDYVRLSVTDRCNLRCTYCMSETMQFLPREELLSVDELDRLCAAFVARGVRRIRLTGGEPLVRRDLMALVERLSRHLHSGALAELTLTTNGLRLAEFARRLAAAGVRRVNVSLDTLRRDTFARIARADRLDQVLEGIRAAREAGIAVKINTVALREDNASELPAIIEWAHAEDLDITLIETMPLGPVDVDRTDQFVSLTEVRRALADRWTLIDLPERTGGPARYVRVAETGGRLGFITPLTHNFCDDCSRIRVTCRGTIFMCLGQDASIDLRAALRADASDGSIYAALDRAMVRKPRAHDFLPPQRGDRPAVARYMSVTGG